MSVWKAVVWPLFLLMGLAFVLMGMVAGDGILVGSGLAIMLGGLVVTQ